MPDFLWPYGLKHARLCCPSLSPGDCSNSCPLSHWCCLIISSSATLFSFCLQSFPSSVSFPMSRFFPSGGQSIGASASASVLPSNEYSGLISFRIDWFDLIAVSKGLSRVFSKTTILKYQLFSTLYGPALTSVHDYWKNYSFDYMDLCQQVMSLLFNMLSRFVITFLPRSEFLNLWLQSPSAAILEPEKIKSVSAFIFFPYCLPWSDGIGYHVLSFLKVEF